MRGERQKRGFSENWRRIPKLCRGHQPAESSQKISAIRGEAGSGLGYGQARKKTQIQQIIFTHGYRNTQKNWLTQQITFFGIRNFPKKKSYLQPVFLTIWKKRISYHKRNRRLQTAFVAEWGTGKPILGFLAEYDALPGLGQEPVCTYQPLKTPGHGCGHNLLGTACAGAACALKERMEKAQLSGTIRVYGCPAEEIIIGKIQMNEAGVFDDLDAAITWHPFDRNRVSYDIWQAQDMKNYNFTESKHMRPNIRSLAEVHWMRQN